MSKHKQNKKPKGLIQRLVGVYIYNRSNEVGGVATGLSTEVFMNNPGFSEHINNCLTSTSRHFKTLPVEDQEDFITGCVTDVNLYFNYFKDYQISNGQKPGEQHPLTEEWLRAFICCADLLSFLVEKNRFMNDEYNGIQLVYMAEK